MDIIAPSRWLGAIVRESKVGKGWRVHHIANGVDPARFAPRSRRSQNGTTLLIVNRNFADEQKGFSIALEALGMAGGFRTRIILAGQNSAWAATQIPRGFSVSDAGFVQDQARLAELYAQADIFLFASPAENFPCVVLEAMAAGCCVVATPSGGVTEQIEHGRSGLLAEGIDGGSLAAVLREALADAELRARLGSAARERVTEHFSEQRMIDGHLKLYRAVMDEN